jgi:hypothetical protein
MITELIWCMFIYYRKVKLDNSRNVLDSLPLLLTIIWFILIEIDSEKYPLVFSRQVEKNNLTDNSEETYYSNLSGEDLIKQKYGDHIVKILLTKNSHFIDKTKLEEIRDYIKADLKKTELLKNFVTFSEEDGSHSFDLGIWNEANLKEIINLLKINYEQLLKLKHFDERIFLLESSFADCSPVKFTPLKRQKLSKEVSDIIPKGKALFLAPETLDTKDPSLSSSHTKPSFSFGRGEEINNVSNPNPSFNNLKPHANNNNSQRINTISINSINSINSSMIYGEAKGFDTKEWTKVY